MLVVEVKLISARTGKITKLGTATICNVGGDIKKGDYNVAVANKRDAGNIQATLTRPQRKGSVKSYPRLSYNVWRLVIRALKSAFPEEK